MGELRNNNTSPLFVTRPVSYIVESDGNENSTFVLGAGIVRLFSLRGVEIQQKSSQA